MKTNKWKWLQLFAGEAAGEGGDGASSGENSADAGHQRLRELGVPEDKIRRNRAYKANVPAAKPAEAEQVEPQNTNQEQVAAAEEPTEGSTEDNAEQTAKRLSWDEIMADPEYQKEMQKIIKGRLKKSDKELANHTAMADAYKALARYYGLDADNIDFTALAGKITADDALIERRAMENGVDNATQRKLDAYEAMKSQQENFTQEQARRQLLANHYQGLKTQAEAMKTTFPNFDLDKELNENPMFARLTGPGVNIPVEQAYKMTHHDEIVTATVKAAQQQTATKMSNAIRSGSRRPEENGTTGQAPSVATFDYKNASKAQRDALKKRIYEAGQRGEYLKPGH